jgi:hypothetical protein
MWITGLWTMSFSGLIVGGLVSYGVFKDTPRHSNTKVLPMISKIPLDPCGNKDYDYDKKVSVCKRQFLESSKNGTICVKFGCFQEYQWIPICVNDMSSLETKKCIRDYLNKKTKKIK